MSTDYSQAIAKHSPRTYKPVYGQPLDRESSPIAHENGQKQLFACNENDAQRLRAVGSNSFSK